MNVTPLLDGNAVKFHISRTRDRILTLSSLPSEASYSCFARIVIIPFFSSEQQFSMISKRLILNQMSSVLAVARISFDCSWNALCALKNVCRKLTDGIKMGQKHIAFRWNFTDNSFVIRNALHHFLNNFDVVYVAF